MAWGVSWPHGSGCSGEALETRLGPDHSYVRYCTGCRQVVYLYLDTEPPLSDPIEAWLKRLTIRDSEHAQILTIQ